MTKLGNLKHSVLSKTEMRNVTGGYDQPNCPPGLIAFQCTVEYPALGGGHGSPGWVCAKDPGEASDLVAKYYAGLNEVVLASCG